MLAPQSGQTRLRIAEIKLVLVFLTAANEAIIFSPFCGGLSRRMPRTLSAGPQERIGRALTRGLRLRASDSNVRATVSPNACSDGIGFGQDLSSQHEGDRIVVRRFHPIVYLARASLYRSANKCPIDLASWLKQTARRRCRRARSGDRILKSRC